MKESDQSVNKRKDTILRGSPLLELFLSDVFVNRNEWVDLMTGPFKELHTRLINFYGETFIDMLKPLKITGEAFDLFDSEYPESARSLILNAVVIMGCEIGDKDATRLFSEGIVRRLVEIRTFDKNVLGDKERSLIASTFIVSVLNTGVVWAEEINANNPDEFSRFISTINF